MEDLQLSDGHPALVSAVYRERFRLLIDGSGIWAQPSGKLRFNVHEKGDMPVVGDWVVYRKSSGFGDSSIERILKRRTFLVRKESGSGFSRQILASNIDYAFILSSLNAEFNVRRIERFIALAQSGGVHPIVLLTKADLNPSAESMKLQVQRYLINLSVECISSATGYGISGLDTFLKPGKSVAFLGTSGVGKSTLVNRLLGCDAQSTKSIRESDSKGRHTTSRRELFLLPSGAMVIDTPGLREIQLWTESDALDQSFEDILKIQKLCEYRNCSHHGEPGCAVKEALDSGFLEQGRFLNYEKLIKETEHWESKNRIHLKQKRKQFNKQQTKKLRRIIQGKYGSGEF
jgi:ribosome biogenesis GTPase